MTRAGRKKEEELDERRVNGEEKWWRWKGKTGLDERDGCGETVEPRRAWHGATERYTKVIHHRKRREACGQPRCMASR